MSKKKALLVWWESDNRPELLQPFIDMSDKIEFTQLIYKNPKERTGHSSPFPMIFWHDYPNAQGLLKAIKPEVIIGVTESIFSAALINTAKKNKIPFYGLQHGFSTENISEISIDTRKFSIGFAAGYLKSTTFFLRSFSLLNFKKFCSAVYFYWLYPRVHIHKILTSHTFPWLVPDYYICFSPYSAEHYKKLYGLSAARIKYIGILWFDKIFRQFARLQMHSAPSAQRYYLLIDTCFDNYHKKISTEQINRCYNELAQFCEQQGARLKIKLHPWNYKHAYFLSHPAIDYVTKVEDDVLYELIAGCQGCFAFYSTLTLPVLAIKPVTQIRYDDVYLKLSGKGEATPVVDFFSFTKADIHFATDGMNGLNKEDLDYLLYKSDGHAAQRLAEILLSA